jgi:hypothetical protein
MQKEKRGKSKMDRKLQVDIVRGSGDVVGSVWIVDPRIEYCRRRNELLPPGLTAVVHQPRSVATDLASSKSRDE